MIIEKMISSYMLVDNIDKNIKIALTLDFINYSYSIKGKNGNNFIFQNQKINRDLPFKVLNLLIQGHQFAQQELNNYKLKEKGTENNVQ